jgi:hypothetical protein
MRLCDADDNPAAWRLEDGGFTYYLCDDCAAGEDLADLEDLTGVTS